MSRFLRAPRYFSSLSVLITLGCILSIIAASLWSFNTIKSVYAQDDKFAEEFPVLSKRFKSGAEIDFVIVLDNSGSMGSLWQQIKDGLKGFVDAVPDGDRISIVTFGDPLSEQQGSTCYRFDDKEAFKINSGARTELKRNIEILCPPRGRNTDLGVAVERTLDSLAILGASKLKVVFFFTDFRHEPPGDSPYNGKINLKDKVWQNLKEEKRNRLTDRTLIVYGYKLEDNEYNLDLVKEVFPELESRKVRVDHLTDWFSQIQAEILRDRLRVHVQSEIDEQVKRDGSGQGSLIINNIFQEGDEILAQVQIKKPAGVKTNIDIEGLTNIKIELKEETQSNFDSIDSPNDIFKFSEKNASPSVVNVPIATVKVGWFDWSERKEEGNVSISLTGLRLLGPEDELRKLHPLNNLASYGLPASASTLGWSGSFRWTIPGHLPWWLIISVILIVGIASLAARRVYVYRRNYKKEEYLNCGITITSDENGALSPLTIKKSEEVKSCYIGNAQQIKSSAKDKTIPLEGENWTIQFEACKPTRRKDRGTYMRIMGAEATVPEVAIDMRGRKEFSSTDLVLIKSQAEIRLGQYTIKYKSLNTVREMADILIL